MSFIDLFDQSSLDARWTGSSATLDDANDRVDLSAGELIGADGLIDSASWDNLDLTFVVDMSAQNTLNVRLLTNQNGGGVNRAFLYYVTDATGSDCLMRLRMDMAAGSFPDDFISVSGLAYSGIETFRVTRVAGVWTMYHGATQVGSYTENATDGTEFAWQFGDIYVDSTSAYLHSITLEPSSEPNVDPQLDSPQADVIIQEGQTGFIQAGANISDGNNDPLTFSISPDISLVTGFGFNTSTGAISHDGSLIQRAVGVEYTITGDDGNGGTPATDVFIITVIEPVFIIDSSSTLTPTASGQLTVNFSNELGAISASCSAGSLVVESQGAGQAVLTVPNPPSFGDQTLNFETDIVITLSDGTNTDTLTIQIQVASGHLFAQISEIDANGDYANDSGIAVGDYAHYKDITGDIDIDPATGLIVANPSSNISYSYSIYDVTDNTWSDAYLTNSNTAETVKPVITLIGADPLVWVQGSTWSDPQATVTDNVDATKQIDADNAPDINAVGPYTLNYNATDAAGNTAVQVTRAVNVVASDITPAQFSFDDVANAELNTLHENIQQVIDVDAGQTVTAANGLVSNDNGAIWASSVQMVTGQTFVKASINTGDVNSILETVTVIVNGISADFNVTTKALVTLSFSIGSSDPVVDSAGANLTYVYPVWELWDKIPEDQTAVVVDSGVNFSVSNGLGSVQTSNAITATTYYFIARDAGNSPANYIRTSGQAA